jgi:hypothetical protein
MDLTIIDENEKKLLSQKGYYNYLDYMCREIFDTEEEYNRALEHGLIMSRNQYSKMILDLCGNGVQDIVSNVSQKYQQRLKSKNFRLSEKDIETLRQLEMGVVYYYVENTCPQAITTLSSSLSSTKTPQLNIQERVR